MAKQVSVTCSCGWRGRRVWRCCEVCYEPCYCAGLGYGACPKCRSFVATPTGRREWKRMDEAAERYCNSPEGKAHIAQFRRTRESTARLAERVGAAEVGASSPAVLPRSGAAQGVSGSSESYLARQVGESGNGVYGATVPSPETDRTSATAHSSLAGPHERFERVATEALSASSPATSERKAWCSGCGARWSPDGIEVPGVVNLCGDCWRKVQSVLHAASSPVPSDLQRRVLEWAIEQVGALRITPRIGVSPASVQPHNNAISAAVNRLDAMIAEALPASPAVLPRSGGQEACPNGKHVWPEDYSDGDTCDCGKFYLHVHSDEGGPRVIERT